MSNTRNAQAAYGAASAPVRTARGTEYAIFEKITARLARAARPDAGMVELAGAIHDNRRLWTLLAGDVASQGNALPQNLRAQLFFLSEFTDQHSRAVLNGKATPAALIEINRAVMQGLAHQTSQSQALNAEGV